MKTLNLIIKQKYFDEILQGTKKQEFREVKPTTYKRLVLTQKDGDFLLDENNCVQPMQYDALQLYVGYNKDRDSMLVEVVGIDVEIFVDEEDEVIVYEYDVDEDGNPLEWVAMQVVYNLGRIIESKVKDKK